MILFLLFSFAWLKELHKRWICKQKQKNAELKSLIPLSKEKN